MDNADWTKGLRDRRISPALNVLLGNHVEASSCTSEWRKHVEAGRLRLLAIYRNDPGT